jgi:hypothetical protein
LLTADVVVADISTSNANAFYELGVRHALRPYTTITIAEDKMTFPFDVSHLAVRKYHHLGEGIDFGEAIRMKDELAKAIRIIMEKPEKDSPVYSFFTDLDPPTRRKIERALAQSSPAAVAAAAVDASAGGSSVSSPTMSVLMEQANAAFGRSDFETAKSLLNLVRSMAPKDPYIVQRLAFATYESKSPNALEALNDAAGILVELAPVDSTDTETLGLWGAIHKRIWDLTNNKDALNTSILAYEKGFYLKNDYYNGINLAYLYNLRASLSTGEDATADIVLAQRIRKRILTICEPLVSDNALRPESKYWILATMAEAHVGLGNEGKAQECLTRAKALNQAKWMTNSTEEQLTKLRKLLTKKIETQKPSTASA